MLISMIASEVARLIALTDEQADAVVDQVADWLDAQDRTTYAALIAGRMERMAARLRARAERRQGPAS